MSLCFLKQKKIMFINIRINSSSSNSSKIEKKVFFSLQFYISFIWIVFKYSSRRRRRRRWLQNIHTRDSSCHPISEIVALKIRAQIQLKNNKKNRIEIMLQFKWSKNNQILNNSFFPFLLFVEYLKKEYTHIEWRL